ncbi:PHA/PHB synthase family protein [Parasphingopyxis marina]|uniref:Class I poly(R)-hydroxyalkanoic acid synthase n=1 Tax=Parasphingopyxis marina TaxID=2761622 RepID=A0A842I1G8_9SPHN|nr:class I poly(R)-hydroxyalkanoic acid synthase [Parasphingopyxis marina]MBC2778737.1 class I poly(R)-hydroxyalkanoic acid synthase [Parasphingopyxis marina]
MASRDESGAAGTTPPMPSLEDMQHWTGVIGRAQQMMLEHAAAQMKKAGEAGEEKIAKAPSMAENFAQMMPSFASAGFDPQKLAEAQTDFWDDSIKLWNRFMNPEKADGEAPEAAKGDRRFAAPQWQASPVFDMLRQGYLLLSEHLLRTVDLIDGVDDKQKQQLRFATRQFVDALSPSNFALTNPEVIEMAVATKGESILKGLEHMLADMAKGQLSHVDADAFTLGENIATTPGKVVRRTPLYELIQYSPTTKKVHEIPLVIFPPWINRFYILDLNPQKSFVRWAVEQGFTVFMVSWKSADETMADVTQDDYVIDGQVDAIEAVRDLLDVPSVNVIGYCVAGTTLAMTLAWLAAKGEADKVASATFFTAQVDFTKAGELQLFIDDLQAKLVEQLGSETGYLDGRYMAATFNLLRDRDLIWNYVVNNYLKGQEYPAFDLLYWNGDTTNLPAKWHRSYLRDLYRDNKLAQPGGITIGGVPIDLHKVETPAYIQAGREDHIAPPESVWKITEHFRGPIRFLLAGSGHIAGVINPPSSGKYQYWTNEAEAGSLADFIAGAKETPGSWWPDWLEWLTGHAGEKVPVKGKRKPGKGKKKPLEDAPGTYVKSR